MFGHGFRNAPVVKTYPVDHGETVLPQGRRNPLLPVVGTDEVKQTNEIGMFIPLVEDLNISGKNHCGHLAYPAKLAGHLVEERWTH